MIMTMRQKEVAPSLPQKTPPCQKTLSQSLESAVCQHLSCGYCCFMGLHVLICNLLHHYNVLLYNLLHRYDVILSNASNAS